MPSRDLIIVGAGPSGLAAAIAAKQRGIDYQVIEQGALVNSRFILAFCGLLWLTSSKADLSTAKEEQFNHSRLVPQFFPRIPCYKAEANERLQGQLRQAEQKLEEQGEQLQSKMVEARTDALTNLANRRAFDAK